MTFVGEVKRKLAPVLAVSLALGIASCGVKNDLVLPDGKPTPKSEKDPSKPPQQTGR
ncbi:MAG TPA: lipoprotein [Rhizomicrobium sp.]